MGSDDEGEYEVGLHAISHETVTAASEEEAAEKAKERADPGEFDVTETVPLRTQQESGGVHAEDE